MRPWLDGAVTQRFAGVRQHQIEIDVDYSAEAAAGLACTERTIERKEIRHRVAISDFTMGAMQMIAEWLTAPTFLRQEQIQAALAIMKRLLERIQNAFFVGIAQCEAVHDDLQRLRSRRSLRGLVNFQQRLIRNKAVKSGLIEAASDIHPGRR